MRIINIGRSSNNDIVISNDVKVSRTHCQIIQDDMGNFRLIDLNSANGTYINGVRRAGEVILNRSDIVRIGNTTLPWQAYFNVTNPGGYPYPNPYPNPTPQPTPVQTPPGNGGGVGIDEPDPQPKPHTSSLGVIALLLSLVGAGLLIYVVISTLQAGIFGLWWNITYAYISAGANVLAFALASFVSYKIDDEDISASFAKWLSGFQIMVIIGFVIYLKTNTQALNPFN